ncbi:MFS transporter [Paraburkholderia sediminicola]|uniref:MFS transporter n=1 Tax=Paraburkholderia sediminicola TaxID=458836 RepID=UPI0038BD9413
MKYGSIEPAGDGIPLPTTNFDSRSFGWKAICAIVAGNVIEYYDFIIYTLFAVYIGRTYFPLGDKYGSLLASLATLGVGFVARPVGAVVLGTFADKRGRKPALYLSILLMTFGALGIAATPSYARIGIAAPIIVVMSRMIQGFAVGGEAGTAISMLAESAPSNRRGFYTSWQLATQGLAGFVGAAVGVAVAYILGQETLASWGWRIPFLFSLGLIPIAIYIRSRLPETFRGDHKISSESLLRRVLTDHRGVIVKTVLSIAGVAVAFQIGGYMGSYAIQTLHLPVMVAQMSLLLPTAGNFFGALIGGALSDKYGRMPVMVWPLVVLLVVALPCFGWLNQFGGSLALVVAAASIPFLAAITGAAALVTIPELIPTYIRGTGVALVYSTATAIFGGSTQFVITCLMSLTHKPIVIGGYLMVWCCISLIAIYTLRNERRSMS